LRTLVTFRLYGPAGGSAALVTATLGISPTRAFEAGAPANRRTHRRRDHSLWMLGSTAEPEDGIELTTQLRRLLDQLEPVTPKPWRLVEQGYDANWFRYLGSQAAEHAAELDRG
jgi:hypothetical protein